jgi:hypothetical protein
MLRALVVVLGLLAASRVSAGEAEKLFWQVFNGGEYARIGELVAALEKESVAHPEEARTFLLLGVTHTWRLAEPSLSGMRDPAAESKAAHVPAGAQRDAMLAQAEQSLKGARASIDDGVRRMPRFNLFGRFILDAGCSPPTRCSRTARSLARASSTRTRRSCPIIATGRSARSSKITWPTPTPTPSASPTRIRATIPSSRSSRARSA